MSGTTEFRAALDAMSTRLMPTNDGQTDTGDVPALLRIARAMCDYADQCARNADICRRIEPIPASASVYDVTAEVIRGVLTAYLTPPTADQMAAEVKW